MILLKSKQRLLTFLVVLVFGIIIFLLGLGSTGLVDETPPLFAAAGKAMSESGDWLTPKVNGIFRFDKPPLIYWLMGLFYSLPKNEVWDSLGTISARLPSALASLFLMLMIGDTIYCWPQKGDRKLSTPIVASLSFALSPLLIVWSRTAVSDALLCGNLGISLLLFWRRMASNKEENCISPWFFLGLAILTKGPVAFVLASLTIASFLSIQKDWRDLLDKIKPKRGLLITVLLSLPWYVLELIKEGRPFWDSFFGYHNFQRYTSVVNNHAEPIWFFLYVMIIGSLPFTPFLFHGIFEAFKDLKTSFKKDYTPSESLFIYCLCWLGSVFIFFSISATKLPSYWLPAMPAVAILTSYSYLKLQNQKKAFSSVWIINLFILLGMSIAFFLSNIWLNTINDPEMPNLASNLLSTGIILKARLFFFAFAFVGIVLFVFRSRNTFLYLQLLLLLGQTFLMQPIRKLGDTSRQLPLRNISKQILNTRQGGETLAMIGIRKPSLHFYSKQIVFYESRNAEGVINLSERLTFDRRINFQDKPNYDNESFLVVIDKYSSSEKYWSNIRHQKLGVHGIYNLWRIKKSDLNAQATNLLSNGFEANWRNKKVEKF
ncbi:glycosyltransferase family 39 protein [Prochlorococcus sp. AH-716-O22]|nr:glycosyltransferase family 39 protein [Prochlorococcus sp. AH-716-O22]